MRDISLHSESGDDVEEVFDESSETATWFLISEAFFAVVI